LERRHLMSRLHQHLPDRRLAIFLLPVALFMTVPGCADDIDEPVVAPVGDQLDDDLGTDPALVGLEVTARGDVTEVVAPIAFRLDKHGIDAELVAPERDDPEAFDDEDFGDLDLVEEGVLVLDVRENDVVEGANVEVTGTDLAEAERLFDIDLDDALYGGFDDELVIVADRVTTDPAGPGPDRPE
jgi:hypothetical protein